MIGCCKGEIVNAVKLAVFKICQLWKGQEGRVGQIGQLHGWKTNHWSYSKSTELCMPAVEFYLIIKTQFRQPQFSFCSVEKLAIFSIWCTWILRRGDPTTILCSIRSSLGFWLTIHRRSWISVAPLLSAISQSPWEPKHTLGWLNFNAASGSGTTRVGRHHRITTARTTPPRWLSPPILFVWSRLHSILSSCRYPLYSLCISIILRHHWSSS